MHFLLCIMLSLMKKPVALNTLQNLRVALVHDWLTGMRGGEKVLEVLCELFPAATLFTLVHNRGSVAPTIERMQIRTSFVQRFPFVDRQYRYYLPLFPAAIESFDLSGYDLIISSSHCAAKGVIPPAHALHVCYCHTPMRYVWDQYEEYFGKDRASWLVRQTMSVAAPRLRAWDVRTSSRVHHFIANSHNVAERIRRIYGRESEVVHAPVDVERFTVSKNDEGYFLLVSALVPYKRVDLAVEAFNRMGERLLIVGSGPDLDKLRARARPNVQFLGWQTDDALVKLYAGCRALIFPGEEDFGIVPLEAMASGKPVVAYAKGGALETVVEEGKAPTGIFFHEQRVEALAEAVRKVKKVKWNPQAIRRHALKFDRKLFRTKIEQAIAREVSNRLSR